MGKFDEEENYFCEGSIPTDIRKAKKQICGENAEIISRLRLESCTTGNVPPEVRNHGFTIIVNCLHQFSLIFDLLIHHLMLFSLANTLCNCTNSVCS